MERTAVSSDSGLSGSMSSGRGGVTSEKLGSGGSAAISRYMRSAPHATSFMMSSALVMFRLAGSITVKVTNTEPESVRANRGVETVRRAVIPTLMSFLIPRMPIALPA
jgi:hypothetical protein